jgi:DNA-binding response OmpR family regulator
VHSREQLIRSVWGPKFFGERKTVDVHVRWLREKSEPFLSLPFRITTVYGVGYRLDRLADESLEEVALEAEREPNGATA